MTTDRKLRSFCSARKNGTNAVKGKFAKAVMGD
jgi:hypothetical protein